MLRRLAGSLSLLAWITLAILLIGGAAAPSATPARLEISLPDSTARSLSSEDLRKHPRLVSLVVSDSPAYPGIPLKMSAVPLRALLPQRYAQGDLHVVFECLDGFVASIPAARVLSGSPEEPEAFLAIEDPAAPWPPLKTGADTTAGPFYLVWKPGKRNRPVHEEWPYQIARIAVKRMHDEFRAIAPDASIGAASPIGAGFQVFLRNCSPCHTLNGVGESGIGPDLNVPMNPTEYFKPGLFEKYVRNPDAVQNWKDRRMPSFPPDVMSDAELAGLRAYLEYMALRKSPASPGE